MQALKTSINVLGRNQGTGSSMTGLNNNYTYFLEKEGNVAKNDELIITSNQTAVGNLTRVNATVTAKKDVFITSFSSLFENGIAIGSNFIDDEIYIWLCRQTWQGEAQWQKTHIKNFGFFPKTAHHSTESFHIVNTGSFTTAKFYPTFFIEDVVRKKVWAFQFEPVGNYHVEIGYDKNSSCLFVNLECVNDRYLQSGIMLKAGETYSTEHALYGEISGDINDALRELTYARRKLFNKGKHLPVIYNDYMNALWGNPDEDKLIPLIDAAAKVGAEIFCIDAGWFMLKSKGWEQCLGDWNVSKDRFENYGFKGIIDYINSKSMKAGCWLEMECVSQHSEAFKYPDSWFLRKYGKRIGADSRYFFDYTNPEVCKYMRSKVKALYDMGIRYVKNDYNECTGSGVDFNDGNSLGIGVNRALHGFFEFIDSLKEEFSDLIIENCGSGAMRSDYATLSHFDLQSVTDQEDYVLNHVITAGTLLNMLPEHMGVWAYPIPLLFRDINNPEMLDSAEYKEKMSKGEQTAFNMVNGMMGSLYLSGRIDKADDKNFAIIKDGIVFYKVNQEIIFGSAVQFITNIPKLSGGNDFSAILFDNGIKGLLFVFRLGDKNQIDFNLERYYSNFTAKIGYGNFGGKAISVNGKSITINMPERNSAMVIEIQRA